MKVTNYGQTIEGLPDEAVLRHPEAPGEIGAALDAREEALQALAEERRRFALAERAAQESTLRVRGERERWAAEVRDKVREEARALRAAQARATAAAAALVDVVARREVEVRALGARLALEAHARAVDAAVEVEQARARFTALGGRRVGLRADLDPVAESRQAASAVRRSILDDLDTVNAHRLADLAGSRCGLVEVEGRGGVRLLTTERRAALLVERRGSGWSLVEDEEAAA